jgi:hypothetical protein
MEERHMIYDEPIFIKEDQYRAILRELGFSAKYSKDAEDIMASFHNRQAELEKGYEIWQQELEDIQRKFIYIDKVLFENKR